MMEELNNVPSFLQPSKPKRLTLDQLQEERKRLTEINRINRLNAERNKLLQQEQEKYAKERQQRVEAAKKVGIRVVNVFKGGLEKISELDKSRTNAKPLINVPQFPRKGIYK